MVLQNIAERIGHTEISRRDLCKILAAQITVMFLGGVACNPNESSANTTPIIEPPTRTPSETLPKSIELRISVDSSQLERVDFLDIPHTPDTHTSFIQDPQDPTKHEVYFSGGIRGYRAVWQITETGDITEITQPEIISAPDTSIESEYGQLGYSAVSSVLAPTQAIRLGFLHQEFHTSAGYFPFHAQIALTISRDSGQNWTAPLPIVTDTYPEETPDRVTGVGQPSAILIGEYVYLYHTEWLHDKHSIQIKRALVDRVANPDAWESLPSAASLAPSEHNGVPDFYKALPGIQYLPTQKKYLLSYESSAGFFVVISEDGESWGEPQLIFQQKPHNLRERGDVWYSYPTLLPTPGDEMSGLLICSQGVWMEEPHKMVKMPYTVQTA
ncbi:MAG: hypothetical protein WAU07_00165 [Microgenomates group bacterium]